MTSMDLVIKQGKTLKTIVRWSKPPYIYKAISSISKSAPVSISAPGHGLTDGWPVAIVSVKGMTQINAENTPPKTRDYHRATVIDGDTVEFNDINSSDFSDRKSGGYLQFYTPADLTGYTARLSIKDRIGGTLLHSLTTENGGILINDAEKTITLAMSAADTAELTWRKGLYELEMVSATGEVTGLLVGNVTVSQEITT